MVTGWCGVYNSGLVAGMKSGTMVALHGGVDGDGDGIDDDDDDNNALVFYAFSCVLRARICSHISAVGWCSRCVHISAVGWCACWPPSPPRPPEGGGGGAVKCYNMTLQDGLAG